jgi:hypothetical protein
MSNSTDTELLTVEEFQARLGGCAESVRATLDELEALIRRLRSQRGIYLAGELREIPGVFWGILGSARTSAFELWSVLMSATNRTEEKAEILFERAVLRAKEMGQGRAIGVGCCEFWDLATSYIVWRRVDSKSDTLTSPAVVGGDGTLLPVVKCPFCGKDAPQYVQRSRLGRSSIEETHGSCDRLGAMAASMFFTDSDPDS